MIMLHWLILLEICTIISLFMVLSSKIRYRPIAVISFGNETFNEFVNISNVIELQRNQILEEMDNFEYPSGRFGIDAEKLADLTPETGGTPVRSVIISTWRSGSTFLGSILNAMPGNYYHYEPLQPFGVVQIRGPTNEKKAIRNLKKILDCDYTDMEEYMKYEAKYHGLNIVNRRLWRHCIQYPKYCLEPQFLNPFCKLFPLQSLKVVRLRLALAEEMLADVSLNVRILLLVRDPRGTMQSRKHRPSCYGNPDCDDAFYLCKDLVSDYYAAEILNKKYPSRFRVVRYEDLSVNPYNMSRDILQFYGLPFHHKVEQFLNSHTILDRGGGHSTFRDSKSTPFHWIKDLMWNEIKEIEKSCGKAMDLWGYRKMNNSKEHHIAFDPVLPAPFTYNLIFRK